MIRTPARPLRLGVLASLVALSLPALGHNRDGDADGDHDRGATPIRMQIPSGQYVTPTAPRLGPTVPEPRLPAYPGFIAGEAVKSQLSPDGKTLAVMCAGQNSLYKPDGTVDTAASTQFIFIYDVSGGHQGEPVLTQVIQQTNSHVGLVFSPDGGRSRPPAARTTSSTDIRKEGGTWSLARTVALGHGRQGDRHRRRPNASGLGISADGKTLVVANNYNDSIW